MKTINKLKEEIAKELGLNPKKIVLEFPPNEKMGDYALPCFELAKDSKSNPAALAKKLAEKFTKSNYIKGVKNIGPYLNIFITPLFLSQSLSEISKTKNFGNSTIGQNQKILIEFSGPNTNKPQHVGHLRNNCLGQALVNLFKASGHKTIAVNIINDRGIHIVKSMLAWQEFGNGETPESSGIKGDHLVGKYYVKFGQLLKKEQDKYFKEKNIALGKLGNLERKQVEEDFLSHSQWMKKARQMLIAWESGDKEIRRIWKMMNNWVYKGYDKTYRDLDIEFDHLDFESDNYTLGKDIINESLSKNSFYKKEDGSIWVDLTKEGLDQKLLLRSDGTSVYITQDIGTAIKRYKKFKFDKGIYVVASEQDYHFKVLFLTLEKIGYSWSKNLHHLSYGMVSLPGGRIKSREGKTADADNLIADMINQAKKIMASATKKIESSSKEKENIARIVGIGALKFFMLSSSPQKNIVFKPEESISFDGYTATFIQYTHARISNILKKSGKIGAASHNIEFNNEEQKIIKLLLNFPKIIERSALEYNPSILSQYLFDLARAYNHFYQQHSVLNAENENLKQNRLNISKQTKKVLEHGLKLLGIKAPEIM